jgi:hypothetical protein
VQGNYWAFSELLTPRSRFKVMYLLGFCSTTYHESLFVQLGFLESNFEQYFGFPVNALVSHGPNIASSLLPFLSAEH